MITKEKAKAFCRINWQRYVYFEELYEARNFAAAVKPGNTIDYGVMFEGAHCRYGTIRG